MPFTKGQSGNYSGRPRGSISEKTIAINTIFKIMNEHKSNFEAELSKLAENDIIGFYKTFVSPLQPKNFEELEKLDTSGRLVKIEVITAPDNSEK